MIFQFPFEMSFCFFAIAFTTGNLLYIITKDNILKTKINSFYHMLLLIVSVVFITLIYNISWSNYTEYNSTNNFKNIEQCIFVGTPLSYRSMYGRVG